MADLPRTLSSQTPHAFSFFHLLKTLFSNHELIIQMVKRETVARYKGSTMGLAWSFFNPILMLVIYTIVFSEIFNIRWGGVSGDKTQFAIILFTGMIVLTYFIEVLNRAPTLIISNVNYVKKVIFPIEVLTLISVGVALFHLLMSFIILLIAIFLIHGYFHWTSLYIPLIYFPIILMSIGLSWALAALGVYLRDISQLVMAFTSVLMFLSPVFYPIEAVPERLRAIIMLNPLTFIIEQSRAVLLWGQQPNWLGLAIYTATAIFVMWLGFVLFQKTRRGFADVL